MWDSICRFESVIEKPVAQPVACNLATFVELKHSELRTVLPLCQPDVLGGWHWELQLTRAFFRVFCFCASKNLTYVTPSETWRWERQPFGFRFRDARFSVLVQPAPPEQATYSPKPNFMLRITHISFLQCGLHIKRPSFFTQPFKKYHYFSIFW